MRKMELPLKNVVQIFIFIAVIIKVESTKVPGIRGLSKIQEIPQYRFHYYLQDDKTVRNYKSPQEENKNGEKVGSYSDIVDSNGNMRVVNYRVDKSNGLQTDVSTNVDASPLKISLNSPVYNTQTDVSNESTVSSKVSPIVVEPINTQEQKSSKPIEVDSRDEYNTAESTEKTTKITELKNTNQTEDRNDDIKDEQTTDQVLIQDEGITIKQTEFTIPFKKPNPVRTDDFKYNDDEAIKKDIVKMIQNINGDHEQSDPRLNFKSTLSDKPIKVVDRDSMEMEQQESYQPSHEHSKFKSQQLSNKPLRLVGYNPSIFGSLYDTQVNYNRPSQIQQPPNLFNQGYFSGFGTHGDIKQQAYDNSGIYYSQPSSTSPQPGTYKGNKKSNFPIPTQPLYYYDPNSMVMLPVYTNIIQNDYSITENKPQPTQPQADSGKNGFNLMQILSGGSFYKGLEQAEGSQQMAVKDSIKTEYNKIEKSKPIEKHDKPKPLETHDKPKPIETQDKLKPPQTLMFYLNPGEPPIDLKSLTSNPLHLTFDQQPESDCNGKTLKTPTVKSNKPLQPIPLCSDCVPALGFMGSPNTKSAVIQQKKSIAIPQVIPIWNGQGVSKLNYLILPTPITK